MGLLLPTQITITIHFRQLCIPLGVGKSLGSADQVETGCAGSRNQQEFIDSDPRGNNFGGQGTKPQSTRASPWDALFYSTWMALENHPASKCYGFGTPLIGPTSAGNDQESIPWKEGSQAFGIGSMH